MKSGERGKGEMGNEQRSKKWENRRPIKVYDASGAERVGEWQKEVEGVGGALEVGMWDCF